MAADGPRGLRRPDLPLVGIDRVDSEGGPGPPGGVGGPAIPNDVKSSQRRHWLEPVRPETADEETYREAKAFAESLGKVTVTAKDTPGFIVNLLLVPYLCEAVRAVEQGLATKEDVDAAMELGCGVPMGPIKLLDFVGLDTTLYIMDVMFAEFHDPKYAAPALLRGASLYGFYDLAAAFKNNQPGRESAATAGFGLAVQHRRVSSIIELAKPLTHPDVEGRKELALFAEVALLL